MIAPKLTGFALLITLACSPAALWAPATDTRSILDSRVNRVKKATGIVVGTIDATGKREVVAVGPGLDGNSLMEIGSVTKVFTSLLLADMVERGEVTLDTPVAKLLPAGVKIPAGKSGKEITLLYLSQHSSGLPRLPANMKPSDPTNPYADYEPGMLIEFLAEHTLRREPGEVVEYSNLGAGLLGYALAQKAETTYEALLKKRVLEPLGMRDTAITLNGDQKSRIAAGHDPSLAPVKNWDLSQATAGAGALRSTTNDMLKFLAAAAGWSDTPLKAAFARMRTMTKATPQPDLSIQLAWHVWNRYGTEIVWHNGGTGGYRSFAGFVPKTKTAVVVLCNTSHSVDDIGRHLLVNQWPLDEFKERIAITLPEETLDKYTGDYRLTPQVTFTVLRKETRMFVKATGQSEGEIFPEKPGEFFAKIVEAQFSFIEDPSTGKVTHLVLHQNGRDLKMERIAP